MAEGELDFTIARVGECRVPSPRSGLRFCLVPEVPFRLERFLAERQRRLERWGHAVAGGAGQDLVPGPGGRVLACTGPPRDRG